MTTTTRRANQVFEYVLVIKFAFICRATGIRQKSTSSSASQLKSKSQSTVRFTAMGLSHRPTIWFWAGTLNMTFRSIKWQGSCISEECGEELTPLNGCHWEISFLGEKISSVKVSATIGVFETSVTWTLTRILGFTYNFYIKTLKDSFVFPHRLTYKVGAPIPITGIQFGMAAEFGYDCLLPADFKVDVSIKTSVTTHLFRILATMSLSKAFGPIVTGGYPYRHISKIAYIRRPNSSVMYKEATNVLHIILLDHRHPIPIMQVLRSTSCSTGSLLWRKRIFWCWEPAVLLRGDYCFDNRKDLSHDLEEYQASWTYRCYWVPWRCKGNSMDSFYNLHFVQHFLIINSFFYHHHHHHHQDHYYHYHYNHHHYHHHHISFTPLASLAIIF